MFFQLPFTIFVNNIYTAFSNSYHLSHTHVSPSGCAYFTDLAIFFGADHMQHCKTIPPLSTFDHCGISLAVIWRIQPLCSFESRIVLAA